MMRRRGHFFDREEGGPLLYAFGGSYGGRDGGRRGGHLVHKIKNILDERRGAAFLTERRGAT